ncbi:MAG: cupredoxin family protein [Burkholderiales bacterium]|nr:MAG: cupredoxin family protein [Burkholderiales bacterium]
MHRFLAPAAAVLALSFAPAVHAHGGEPHSADKHRPPNLDALEKPFGRTGDPKMVSRTIRIDGHDTMRYTPAEITVRQGETVRFIVYNAGRTMHEIVLGTLDDLQQHAEAMRRHPNMEHDEPYVAHVAPGQSGEMIWQFTEAGDFHFGCLIPGHFEAGMRGRIKVVARDAKGK